MNTLPVTHSDQSLKGQGLLSIKRYELFTDTTSVVGRLIGSNSYVALSDPGSMKFFTL